MRNRLVAALLTASVASLVLCGAPARGQEPTAPQPTVSTDGAGDGEREGGEASLGYFVALSLIGGTTAVAILAVQWVRTRPPGRQSG